MAVPGRALSEAFVCSGLGWHTGTQPGRYWRWFFLEEAVVGVQGVGYSALSGFRDTSSQKYRR